ncbi:MAG: hypothetical protein ACK5LT_12870 [Lachnospirales bacterium]
MNNVTEGKRYAVSEKCKCSFCGDNLNRYNSDELSKVKYRYINKDCLKVSIRESQLKENFILLINELVKHSKIKQSECVYAKTESYGLQKEISNPNKQIEIVYRLKEDKLIDSTIFIEKINYLENKILNVENEIQKTNLESNSRKTNRLNNYLDKTCKDLNEFNEDEVENILERVLIDRETINFVLKNEEIYIYKNDYILKYNGISLGYKKINNKIFIDERESLKVNLIFNEFIKSQKLEELLKIMKDKKIPNRSFCKKI